MTLHSPYGSYYRSTRVKMNFAYDKNPSPGLLTQNIYIH